MIEMLLAIFGIVHGHSCIEKAICKVDIHVSKLVKIMLEMKMKSET